MRLSNNKVAGHRQVERPPAWRSRGGQIFVPDDDAPRPALRWLSLPRRAHQLCGLAVFPVPVELADGRSDAGGSRHLGYLRDDPAVSLKFGQEFANRIRRRAPRRSDKWHLDEVVLSIAGKKHWLWRAVDQEGFVLDVLVQSRRDKKAAKRLFRKLLKKQGRAPRVLITDKLRSYAAAKREIIPGAEHRQHKGLNIRTENSHQPTRRRERIMKRFESPRQAQRFLSTHDQIANFFSRRRYEDTAARFHTARSQAIVTWAEVTDVAMAA